MDPAKIGIYSIDRSSLKVDEIKRSALYNRPFGCKSFVDFAPRAMGGN
jgi:hypothetical protein